MKKYRPSWNLIRKAARLLLLMGIVSTLFFAQQWGLGGFYGDLQTRLWNAYQYWGEEFIAKESQVTVIQIDDYSIEQVRELLGEDWPWSRQLYTELLRALFEEYHVSAVGLDISLPDGRDTEGNKALLAMVRKYPVVLAQVFNMKLASEAGITRHAEGGVAIDSLLTAQVLPKASGYIGNNPQLVDVPCIGHINAAEDDIGGVITRVPPLIAWQGKAYPMLSLEMLRCKFKKKYDFVVTAHANGFQIQVVDSVKKRNANRLIVDEHGYFRVPYQVSHERIISISAVDVLLRQVSSEGLLRLKSHMVIVAGAGWGVGDATATPLDNRVFGVEVHVQLLEWLLSNKVNAPDFSLNGWSWIAGFCGLGLLYALLFFGFDAGAIVIVALLLIASWLGFGFWAWVANQWFLPIHPATLFLLFLAFQIPMEWWLAQHTSGRLRRLFQDYLPAPLVAHIVNDNRMDLLQPRKRCLTILFADIANFTRRAEYSAPEELAELTQEILECLTVVAHRHDGTVDKYMGDAVMVFWNAPFTQDNHADKGVQAALDMMGVIEIFNNKKAGLLNGDPVAIRIGVHTGDVVVGNLGTRFRHAYTAIGDAVNVAARLQALARELNESLLISEQTVSALRQPYSFVSKGGIDLKGRQEAIGVYTLPRNIQMHEETFK